MLDIQHLVTSNRATDVQVFIGNSLTAGGEWQTWVKPRGKTMLHIFLVGKGANGSLGASGTGGTGGGSGGQTVLTIPLALLPDRLFLSLGGANVAAAIASYISIAPNTVGNNTLAIANSGSAGGGAAIATVGTMPLGWSYIDSVLAGQNGTVGTISLPGGDLTLPVTGLMVTGGTAGGGSANRGGHILGAGVYPQLEGGIAGTAGTAGTPGSSGMFYLGKFYGGTGGGGSSTGPATDVSGGAGSFGCGGGGGGDPSGTITTNVGGAGGAALAILTCW